MHIWKAIPEFFGEGDEEKEKIMGDEKKRRRKTMMFNGNATN